MLASGCPRPICPSAHALTGRPLDPASLWAAERSGLRRSGPPPVVVVACRVPRHAKIHANGPMWSCWGFLGDEDDVESLDPGLTTTDSAMVAVPPTGVHMHFRAVVAVALDQPLVVACDRGLAIIFIRPPHHNEKDSRIAGRRREKCALHARMVPEGAIQA